MSSEIKETVRQKYGEAALRVVAGQPSSCCGGGASCGTKDPITSDLYETAQTSGLPAEALLASLGCGNPTALAELLKAKSCSTLVQAAESTCSFRPDESVPRARHTVST